MLCFELLAFGLSLRYEDMRENVLRTIVTAIHVRVGLCAPSLMESAL